MGDLFLLRHGQTEWAKAGRHTGLTDVPLTPDGEDQARAAGQILHDLRDQSDQSDQRDPDLRGSLSPAALVLASPLLRARRTAELAGLTDFEIEPDLVEWDYGGYEGLTTDEIRAAGRPGWLIFRDGVVPGVTPGETLDQVAARGRRVLARVRAALAGGDVVLVGHGHALRVLACDWLDRPPDLAQQLVLGPGSASHLGSEHDVPAVRAWNVVAVGAGG